MHIGIDPGLSGAVAVLDHAGALLALHDTPVLTLRTSRGIRQEYDVPGLVALLAPYAGPQAHVVLEESQAMPGQGTRSMFTVGLGFGVWLGILATLGLAHTPAVAPTCGSAAWGSPGTKNRHDYAPCSFTLVPICAGARTTGELKRSCWRGMVCIIWP